MRVEHTYSLSQLWRDYKAHVSQLMFGIQIKAVLAAAILFFTEKFLGNETVLYIYLGFTFVDLVLGTSAALIYGPFNIIRFWFWVVKLFSVFFTLAIFGFGAYAVNLTFDTTLRIVNYVLLLFIFGEMCSILINAMKLGIKIPSPIPQLLVALRKIAIKKFVRQVSEGDVELQKDLEDAMAAAFPINKG